MSHKENDLRVRLLSGDHKINEENVPLMPPYSNKVYLARQKKPDSLYVRLLEVRSSLRSGLWTWFLSCFDYAIHYLNNNKKNHNNCKFSNSISIFVCLALHTSTSILAIFSPTSERLEGHACFFQCLFVNFCYYLIFFKKTCIIDFVKDFSLFELFFKKDLSDVKIARSVSFTS